MADSREIPTPREIAELVACLGEDNTLRLIELRGGTRLHVPLACNVRTSWLAEHFDEVSLMRLAGAMGGCSLPLPLVREWRTRIYLRRGGMSHSEIALKVGNTWKWVQRLASTDWTPMPRAHKGMRQSTPAEPVQMSFDLP